VHASILRNHWKVIQKLKVIQQSYRAKLDVARLNINFVSPNSEPWMQKQPHPVIYLIFIITTTLIFNILTTAARRE